MTNCCRAETCAEIFKSRIARKNLRQYRKKGLGVVERLMVASIAPKELEGARILEIGGGIGVIQTELLASGAREGEIVELVAAYEPYARELAEEKGLSNRSRFRVTDLLEQPDAARPATIVILNRVVCCSPEGIRLTEVASRLAERMLILSFPRDRLVVRLVTRMINGSQRLMGRSFRAFLYSKPSLVAAAQNQGLTLAASGGNFAWEFMALRRLH